MAKSRATDRKFLTLLVAGLVLAVAMTGCGGKSPPEEPEANSTPPPLAGVEPAAPAGPAYSKPVTVASNGFVELSGGPTGWVISESPDEEILFTRLGDGSTPIKFKLGRGDQMPDTCSPSASVAASLRLDGEGGATLVAFSTSDGKSSRFPLSSSDPNPPPPPRQKSDAWRNAECRVLGPDRFLTVRYTGEFAIWDGKGTRIAGQPTDAKIPFFQWDTHHLGCRRVVALTPDSKTLVRQNEDGLTVYDTATAKERVRTEAFSKLVTDPHQILMGTTVSADGARIAAFVIGSQAATPQPDDFNARQWLVVYDAATGKRLSASKVRYGPVSGYGLPIGTNPSVRERQKHPVAWWGGRHVILGGAVFATETGANVATLTFEDTSRLEGGSKEHRPAPRPDDRFWGISLEGEQATVFAHAPPADLGSGGPQRSLTIRPDRIVEQRMKK